MFSANCTIIPSQIFLTDDQSAKIKKKGLDAPQATNPFHITGDLTGLDIDFFEFRYQEMHDCPCDEIGKGAEGKNDGVSGSHISKDHRML